MKKILLLSFVFAQLFFLSGCSETSDNTDEKLDKILSENREDDENFYSEEENEVEFCDITGGKDCDENNEEENKHDEDKNDEDKSENDENELEKTKEEQKTEKIKAQKISQNKAKKPIFKPVFIKKETQKLLPASKQIIQKINPSLHREKIGALSAEACSEISGKMIINRYGRSACVVRTNDSGKKCEQNSDCQGYCVSFSSDSINGKNKVEKACENIVPSFVCQKTWPTSQKPMIQCN